MPNSEKLLKEITCIACPMGCRLSIQSSSDTQGYLIEGYTCPKGKEYALQEMKDPRRMITSGVRVNHGFLALVPVKTHRPIPKEYIFKTMEEINKISVEAPVKLGDIIIENIFGTGVNIVATRDMEKI